MMERRFVARLSAPALLGLVVLVALGWAHAVGAAPPDNFPGCPSLAVTSYLCPGCGMTRAVFALMQGNVSGALQSNALVFALIGFGILFLFIWIRWALGRVAIPALSSMKVIGWTAAVTMIIIVGFVIARNTPFFAPYLAPGGILPG